MKGSHIVSGVIGATILLLLVFSVLVWIKPFNYQAIYIVNPQSKLLDSTKIPTLNCEHIMVLRDLERKGVLLTPQEYTSHIADYYSTLVAFLIGLFVLFTIGSVYGMRITSRKEVEEAKEDIKTDIKKSLSAELKDSKVFYENVVNDIIGRIQDDLVMKSDKEIIERNLDDIVHKQIEFEEKIDNITNTIDSKLDIE